MTADLFISYAWTSEEYRKWVHLLCRQPQGHGYDVLVDADDSDPNRHTGA